MDGSRRQRRGSSSARASTAATDEGRVGVSSKHTLALVNRGGATTSELLDLAREVRDRVQTAFGVTLVPEPTLIGVEL